MELGPKEIGILAAILLGALALGTRKVWVYGWQAAEQVAELKASHERERMTWTAQMDEMRENCRKTEAREKVLLDLALERRDLITKAVDVAVAAKGA